MSASVAHTPKSTRSKSSDETQSGRADDDSGEVASWTSSPNKSPASTIVFPDHITKASSGKNNTAYQHTMARKGKVVPVVVKDPTGWIIDNEFAHFVLMHTNEIKYMCMLGYTFLHGCKVFKKISKDAPFSYKFINLILACTGGGTIVPILINGFPVNMSQDSYPIAIFVAYLIHTYAPVLRDVEELSTIFKAACIVLYESFRAFVVTKLTLAGAAAIPASEFSFPIFGPIICGTIGGCGGAFLPFNKGLDPIKDNGLEPPMFSAFIAAVFFHLFTQLATDVVYVEKKGKVIVAAWFIMYAFYKNGFFDALLKASKAAVPPPVKDDKKKA